jgi:hypothetical protein
MMSKYTDEQLDALLRSTRLLTKAVELTNDRIDEVVEAFGVLEGRVFSLELAPVLDSIIARFTSEVTDGDTDPLTTSQSEPASSEDHSR